MKKIMILAVWMFSLPIFAQQTDTKFVTQLGSYLSNASSFLSANKLSSSQMKKMMIDTWKDKSEDADFVKALNKYFPTQYNKDLPEILSSYYSKELTVQQIDSLVSESGKDNVKRAIEGLAKCDDATYRDKKVDETLTSVAQKTGKKKKKKNLKKFKSDCTEDYRTALNSYTQAAGTGALAEDKVNAIYHTVSIDDLGAYTSFLGSSAMTASHKAETAITDDIYNVQSACISKFQTWTYKAYPTLFTKKQTVVKKRGKLGRGKGKAKVKQQNSDAVIEGGILH